VDVVVDAASVAAVIRTSIVPAILCGRSLCEPVAALVTIELAVRTCIAVEFEFKLCAKGPLAVPTNMRHIRNYRFIPYSDTGTFTAASFRCRKVRAVRRPSVSGPVDISYLEQ
jgi:hypothetical protein